MSKIIQPLVKWEQAARNGQNPSATFYRAAISAQNFNMAYRTREVFSRSWPLGDTSSGAAGTTNIARFRFRSRYGATRLRAHVIIGLDAHNSATDPRLEIDVTISGGATSTIGPFYYGVARSGATDAPDEILRTNGYCGISPATVYECNVKAIDWCRPLAVTVVEEIDPLVDPTVNYFNSTSAASGVPLYDSLRERLLAGSVAMWKQGAGTVWHWGMPDGSSRTRTSGTPINLIDNTTTGSPPTTSPGFYLNNSYRNSESRTTVAYEMAVYGSVAGGAGGSVGLYDSTGAVYHVVTVNNTTPQWFTATANLPTAETWFAPLFYGDGANALSVSAVSLIEWES